MIILKYLTKKILKFQILILLILFFVFLSQKLVRVLSVSIEYSIPKKLIFSLLFFSIPEILKLVLPLSLFLGIFFALQSLQENNEIVAIQTCGIGYIIFFKITLFFNFLVMSFSWINAMWISPLAFNYKNKILTNNRFNSNLLAFSPGQFNIMQNNNFIFFFQKIENENLNNILIVKFWNQKEAFCPIILTAKSGKIYKKKTNIKYYITLNNGQYFYANLQSNDFWITSFKKYYLEITKNIPNMHIENPENLLLQNLWKLDNLESKIELHWRFTIVFVVFIMSILANILGIYTTQKNKFFNLFIGLLFYLTFFFIQTFIYTNYQLLQKYSVLCMWIINVFYIFFIFVFAQYKKNFFYK
ncbi:putative membrane protein [Wigglesworthia glossinidia endosymbiont of Glossina morsitans morsitans (Yale colony)]|uniref:Lipopolysaccharide export system permease protein LptF n=1 Tax=Wigglesworthia glossinidia endosymbiont of Glossina morsitans morsitans (Yale colony) TaxID=1142511 RepID=H6Q5U3_WIGGL|nr:LPS export ABC transporter permease LptF [Wigglesworthia glossinidia]AFA41139.1 putative membrane protein [Wigglesworthia glossinidia endosymbiont of Glossina morsitans morsitans (Yale colony)]